MPHTTPNPHDAEEQLRPYLGELYDAEERLTVVDDENLHHARAEVSLRRARALDKALELLGVRR